MFILPLQLHGLAVVLKDLTDRESISKAKPSNLAES